jgi:hypothetical protein
MTPEALHAAVLAALRDAESAQAQASPPPWQWRTDQRGDALTDGNATPVTGVWWDGGARAGLAVSDHDQKLIAGLRNAAPAMYASIREIIERHALQLGAWPGCAHCVEEMGGDPADFPCDDYRAAARMIPDLPQETAHVLRHR